MNGDQQNYDPDDAPSGGGIAVTDIYFVLFRRKWLIVFGLLLGVLAAGAMWKLRKPLYQSDAKLLVKYVVETTAPASLVGDSQVNKVDDNGASVIGSEIEILTSLDIAHEVARTVGPRRILPRLENTNDVASAAEYILRKLTTLPLQRTKIIWLQFQHPDPEVTQLVLHEMIEAYLKKHDDVHRPTSVSDESLNQQRAQLTNTLAECETNLKTLKQQAGVSSVEDAKKDFSKLETNIRSELLTAEAKLAQSKAAFEAMMQQQGSRVTNGAPVSHAEASSDKVEEYRSLTDLITALNRRLAELNGLTSTHPQVATNLLKLQEARTRKSLLETSFPSLVRIGTPATVNLQSQPTSDLTAQGYLVKSFESMTLTLSNQLVSVRADLRKIEEVEAEIGELERRRASLKKQLDHVELSLQQYKASKTLDNRQNTSISKVQAPSPAVQDFAALHKKLFMAVGGGLAFGLVLAFLMEMVFDRTLKRPKDVEAALAAPLFLTIPFTKLSGLLSAPSSGTSKGALPAPSPGKSGGAEVAPTDLVMPRESNQELKPYHDALRDRLMNYFDVRDMTHKPKLIAVTSAGEGAGVSSVATGLAASLSETGDGNVLLVDMRGQRGAAHAFYHGKPAIGLAEALEDETRGGALVNENLYVVSAGSLDKKLQRILPQQFSQFVPKLKASDYDYIIFDMPPVGQTSVTAKVARFMDMVLMVVESENTDKDAAKRAGTLLADANATVATVLNKHRPYVPAWLHQDIH